MSVQILLGTYGCRYGCTVHLMAVKCEC